MYKQRRTVSDIVKELNTDEVLVEMQENERRAKSEMLDEHIWKHSKVYD